MSHFSISFHRLHNELISAHMSSLWCTNIYLNAESIFLESLWNQYPDSSCYPLFCPTQLWRTKVQKKRRKKRRKKMEKNGREERTTRRWCVAMVTDCLISANPVFLTSFREVSDLERITQWDLSLESPTKIHLTSTFNFLSLFQKGW